MKKILSLLFAGLIFLPVTYSQKTIITGTIKNLAANSIKCSFIPNSVLKKPAAITIPLEEGKFGQQLTITEPTLLSFEEGKNYYSGVIQPGDSIAITYDATDFKNTLSFSGRGKEKFNLVDSFNRVRLLLADESKQVKSQPFPIDELFNKADSLYHSLFKRLVSYKPLMNTESFTLLHGLLAATIMRAKYNGAITIFGDAIDNILAKQQSRLTAASTKTLRNLLTPDERFSDSYFYTTNYANILSVYYDDNIQPKTGNDLPAKYVYLSKRLPIQLRSPVLYLLLEKEIRQHKDSAIETIVAQNFPLSKDSTYKNVLTQKLTDARALKNNMPAPDFSLENTNGEKINLASFKGKVIYIDFWFAACVPCHELFKAINPVKEYFKSNDSVVFLTVNIDNREVWKKALTQFSILGYHAFTENKYRDHAIIKAYNVNGYPTAYIIDATGNIFNIAPSHDPEGLKKEIEAALATGDN